MPVDAVFPLEVTLSSGSQPSRVVDEHSSSAGEWQTFAGGCIQCGIGDRDSAVREICY